MAKRMVIGSRTKVVLGALVLIGAVLGTLGGLAYLKYQEIEAAQRMPPPPEIPEAVLLRAVESVVVRPSVTSIGTVLAPQSIELRTEVVGTIETMAIQSGAIVEPGTLLLKLDDSVEQAQLQGAQATLKIADSTYRRTRQAAAANALSELELEQAEAALEQAKAEIMRIEAVIRKKRLLAPFRAKTGLCDLHVGQYLPEGTRVTMLQGIEDYIHIDFAMPQQVADYVTVGETIDLVTGSQPLKGTIIAIDSQADRLTRSVMARARLDHPPPSLQPNDSVKIRLEYGEKIQATAIPASALRRTPSGSIVYLAVRDQEGAWRARSTNVVPGMTRGELVVILEGITVADLVIADGSFKVHEGSLLADKNETPVTAARESNTPQASDPR